MNRFFLIPARRGSKGVPYKNRSLVPVALCKIPKQYREFVILTSNDKEIIKLGNDMGVKVRSRPDELASDTSTMKSVIIDAISFFNIKKDDTIVILYPTYPDRDFADIETAYSFFIEQKLSSMLCRKETKTHPYMCLRATDEIHGEQIVKHDLYRRQDYPECFEISHFVCMLKAGEITELNNQLYNNSTGFYKISDKLDIDYEEDFEKFKKNNYGV